MTWMIHSIVHSILTAALHYQSDPNLRIAGGAAITRREEKGDKKAVDFEQL